MPVGWQHVDDSIAAGRHRRRRVTAWRCTFLHALWAPYAFDALRMGCMAISERVCVFFLHFHCETPASVGSGRTFFCAVCLSVAYLSVHPTTQCNMQ